MKLKTNEGGFTEKLDQAFPRTLFAQRLDARFDQVIYGMKMSAADFLADQAFGFWGNIDLHGVTLLLYFQRKGYRGVCHGSMSTQRETDNITCRSRKPSNSRSPPLRDERNSAECHHAL
jgi:hypothetical protein